MFDIKNVYRPETLDETFSILKTDVDALPYMGGTDVLIKIKQKSNVSQSLIYLGDVKELKGIFLHNGYISIKSGECFFNLIKNPIIQNNIPILKKVSKCVGSPQIRNVATIGGNICNGAVSADSVPALLVLKAKLLLKNADSERIVPIEKFFFGPGKTVKKREELLIQVDIMSKDYKGYGFDYIKFGQRNVMEIATLGCAAGVKLSNNGTNISDIRIALSVAAPKAIRCYATENEIRGLEIGEEIFKKIKQSILAETSVRESFRASKELRNQLIRELSCRAVENAINRARDIECWK